MWVVYHLREWQTRGFGDVVARASEAPMRLRCQYHELAVKFFAMGADFDEHGV
jgi:hypothetical protein